ncbi:hypothetical protein ACFX13_045369 [Malus domestica]
MPDAFNDAMKVTKSHIPAANALARIDVPVGQNKVVANESSGARLKRGRPPVATEIILSDDIEPSLLMNANRDKIDLSGKMQSRQN